MTLSIDAPNLADPLPEIDWIMWARCESPGNTFWSPIQCFEHCPNALCANHVIERMNENMRTEP